MLPSKKGTVYWKLGNSLFLQWASLEKLLENGCWEDGMQVTLSSCQVTLSLPFKGICIVRWKLLCFHKTASWKRLQCHCIHNKCWLCQGNTGGWPCYSVPMEAFKLHLLKIYWPLWSVYTIIWPSHFSQWHKGNWNLPVLLALFACFVYNAINWYLFNFTSVNANEWYVNIFSPQL